MTVETSSQLWISRLIFLHKYENRNKLYLENICNLVTVLPFVFFDFTHLSNVSLHWHDVHEFCGILTGSGLSSLIFFFLAIRNFFNRRNTKSNFVFINSDIFALCSSLVIWYLSLTTEWWPVTFFTNFLSTTCLKQSHQCTVSQWVINKIIFTTFNNFFTTFDKLFCLLTCRLCNWIEFLSVNF